MLTHHGFSAWIVVDGAQVPEYLVAVDNDTNRVSCWIPGEEGQRFSVYWRDHGGKVDTCAFITLDGFVVPGRFLFGEGIACREGVRTSRTTERPFVFQKIQEDVSSTLESTGKDVGMVTLRIKRITRVASKPANVLQPLPPAALGKRKAGDLYIGFGEDTPAFEQYSSTWSVKPYEQDDALYKTPKTHVSFVFRYRTREFLETQGIIPESVRDLLRPIERPLVRRIVSMPSSMPSSMGPTPPESPMTSYKKMKMMLTSDDSLDVGVTPSDWPSDHTYSQGSRFPQGNIPDARRAVSWKIITGKESPSVPLISPSGPIQFSYVSPVSDATDVSEVKSGSETL